MTVGGPAPQVRRTASRGTRLLLSEERKALPFTTHLCRGAGCRTAVCARRAGASIDVRRAASCRPSAAARASPVDPCSNRSDEGRLPAGRPGKWAENRPFSQGLMASRIVRPKRFPQPEAVSGRREVRAGGFAEEDPAAGTDFRQRRRPLFVTLLRESEPV